MKRKKLPRQMTLMLIKYQFLEKNHIVQKIHSSALLDRMILMLLDLYT